MLFPRRGFNYEHFDTISGYVYTVRTGFSVKLSNGFFRDFHSVIFKRSETTYFVAVILLYISCLFPVYSSYSVIIITWLLILFVMLKICCYLVILLWNMVAFPRIVKVIVAPTNIQARSYLDPQGDSDDFDGSPVEGSDDEEVIETDGDDGNFANDTWRFMEADYSSDELLDRYPFSPLGVAGQPKNWIPPESKPEEYVRMFLGELLQVIVVDSLL